MIHDDKEKFIEMINRVAAQTGFFLPLLEKDYYLTLILSRINQLSEELIFKGGTCLNKIYFSYYRLSEDLDFSMRLPDYNVTRAVRRKCIDPIKKKMEDFAKSLGMRVDEIGRAGRNESKQYVYYFMYQSVVQPTEQQVKFEIGLRFNPILKTERKKVHHKFLHPFTGEPLFDGGEINCFSINEIVSEKLRAAAIRETIAPRDFYDLDFILRNNFNLSNPEVLELFAKKLAEDGADPVLRKYHHNLGRSDQEIADMYSRIEEELFEVLTPQERKNFNLDAALESINKALKDIE